MLYTFNLKYGSLINASLFINGKLHEIFKLEYVGVLGEDWLQFTNVITKEHHLVKEEQFPNHIFKMGRENDCQLKYWV